MTLKFSVAAIILLFLGWQTASAQVFTNDDLSISRLEKNMWVVETDDKASMYIIEGSDKAMLIDTGTKCEKLDSVVRLITQKPLYVVITHLHPDHAGNVKYFDEIYYHPADSVLIGRKGVGYTGKTHYVADGQTFDLGGTTLEVRLMPGHTPGSIVLLDWDAGNCYSGDAFGSGQVWMQLQPHVPMATYAQSCRTMESLMERGITKLYCGHYPHVKKAFDKTYMTEMRQLAEQLSSGTAPEGNPYPLVIPGAAQKPMIVTNGSASIVYDPEHIN
jgi:glyoxylase-like metal-dependent hydrolase (beta-lactamase superfamily II)